MAAMNKGMNLPAISKVLMDFERESDMMDMKETMMSDAVDDVMDDMEDEEEEGDKILKQVLDEIGVDLSQKVSPTFLGVAHLPLILSLVDGHTQRTGRRLDANDVSSTCCTWGDFGPFASKRFRSRWWRHWSNCRRRCSSSEVGRTSAGMIPKGEDSEGPFTSTLYHRISSHILNPATACASFNVNFHAIPELS